jgi:hypothetical protein
MNTNVNSASEYEKLKQNQALKAYRANLLCQQNLINTTTNAIIQAVENPTIPVNPLIASLRPQKDLRTTTEKYNDTQALQQQVFNELTASDRISGQLAQEILTKSNSQDLQFIANNMERILFIIQKSYKLGVLTLTDFTNIVKKLIDSDSKPLNKQEDDLNELNRVVDVLKEAHLQKNDALASRVKSFIDKISKLTPEDFDEIGNDLPTAEQFSKVLEDYKADPNPRNTERMNQILLLSKEMNKAIKKKREGELKPSGDVPEESVKIPATQYNTLGQWQNLTLGKQKEWLSQHREFFEGNKKFQELSRSNFLNLTKNTKYQTDELFSLWLSQNPSPKKQPKGSGIGGIDSSPKLLPFGRYAIHHRKLDNNRLVIKSPAGGHLPAIPSQLISTNLGAIFRRIVGGGLPNGDDIANLSEDERDHLAKVLKICHLDDKIPVYGTKLTKDQQTAREFEILKGEYLAGNNSRELVKKLKRLILNLVKERKLTRSEAYDVLLELDD